MIYYVVYEQESASTRAAAVVSSSSSLHFGDGAARCSRDIVQRAAFSMTPRCTLYTTAMIIVIIYRYRSAKLHCTTVVIRTLVYRTYT